MMKTAIVLLLTVSMVFCSSCKFIKSKFSKKVDTLSAFVDTLSQAEKIDSSVYQSTLEQIQSQTQAPVEDVQPAPQPVSSPDARYFVIVGCFKVPENATKYAEKIRGMGHDGEIIEGSGGFQMVSAKSYTSLKSSLAEIDQFRTDVTPNAWVFVRR